MHFGSKTGDENPTFPRPVGFRAGKRASLTLWISRSRSISISRPMRALPRTESPPRFQQCAAARLAGASTLRQPGSFCGHQARAKRSPLLPPPRRTESSRGPIPSPQALRSSASGSRSKPAHRANPRNHFRIALKCSPSRAKNSTVVVELWSRDKPSGIFAHEVFLWKLICMSRRWASLA